MAGDERIPQNLIDCEPAFAAQLGLTVDEVKALDLRELSNRAFDRGLCLSVSFGHALTGEGHLKLSVGDDPTAIRSRTTEGERVMGEREPIKPPADYILVKDEHVILNGMAVGSVIDAGLFDETFPVGSVVMFDSFIVVGDLPSDSDVPGVRTVMVHCGHAVKPVNIEVQGEENQR